MQAHLYKEALDTVRFPDRDSDAGVNLRHEFQGFRPT
jgi:hypothetical protein